MSRKDVHKKWCDLMVTRAKKAKEQSDYPYKLMIWKENKYGNQRV